MRLATLAWREGDALPTLQDLAVQEDSPGLPAEPGRVLLHILTLILEISTGKITTGVR